MNLTDLDLDVVSLTKDFPDNESDAFVYIRKFDENDDSSIFINGKGNEESMADMFHVFMDADEVNTTIVLNAVLDYLYNNKEVALSFQSDLSNMLKEM